MSKGTMKAIVYGPLISGKEPTAIDVLQRRDDVPIPVPSSGQVLVKIEAAAQNGAPDAIKLGLKTYEEGAIIGHDFAGTIVELGPDVGSESGRYVGERVAGFLNGGMTKADGGAYAEYTVADANVLISLGSDVSFEEGASLPLSTFTAVQGLFQNLTPPIPTPIQPATQPIDILVWGGATAVGIVAIQLAKFSGLRVLTTASASNHELLKGYGADLVFDYRDEKVVKNIREATGNHLGYVFDSISTASTSKLVQECVGSEGGNVAFTMQTGKVDKEKVTGKFSLVYTALGKAMTLPYPMPAFPDDYAVATKFAKVISQLVQEGGFKALPIFRPENGFKDIGKWQDWGAKPGNVRAQKVVFLTKDL